MTCGNLGFPTMLPFSMCRTCLHWACKRNHAAVVAYLLHAGADKEIRTKKGERPAQLTSKREIRKMLGELVLKVRIQNPNLRENDFIEIELDRQELTYKELLRVSCRELGVNPEHVQKIRKLPNTMLRKKSKGTFSCRLGFWSAWWRKRRAKAKDVVSDPSSKYSLYLRRLGYQ
ncbi:hypothetical protein llap_12884 [Limosa lapponica baueri]|uniref:Uncharacterized protein n=1 Tax=Limosa lapponica baueri TaxID=1758121 RepID=A0A2I0TSM7_LIMLA|nr:hypothetical protein llap_12884 [Limosa lapponica baueri]